MVEFGICMPKETIDRIEAAKGQYMSRGRYIWKAVDKLLAEEEEKQQVTIAVGSRLLVKNNVKEKSLWALKVQATSPRQQLQNVCNLEFNPN